MIGFYSWWPLVASLTALALLAATPAFRWAEAPPKEEPYRITTLDGLRGFLALAVFFNHASLMHRYLLDGSWQPPSARLYANLGQLGVGMFFMITAYLFWSRVQEFRPPLWWAQFFVRRIFRIMPVYLLAIGIMLGVVLIGTGFSLREPPLRVAKEVAEWLAGGLSTGPDVNGFRDTKHLVFGVTWSLRYEWCFYAALPLLSLCAFDARLRVVAPAVVLALSLAAAIILKEGDGIATRFIALALFACGALSQAVLSTWSPRPPKTLASLGVIACVLVCLLAFPSANFPPSILFMGLAFFLVAGGADLFGLLRTRGAARLGNISFGVYLLHGLVTNGALSIAGIRALALSSPQGHWVVVFGVAVVLVAASTLAHVAVERPGIALGKAVEPKLDRPSRSPVPLAAAKPLA